MIDSLPDELLVLIFNMMEDYHVVPWSSRMRVASVARRWRQLANSTPWLWTRMDIVLYDYDYDYDHDWATLSKPVKYALRCIDTFRLHVARTGLLPLQVTVIYLNDDFTVISTRTLAAIENILSTSDRWDSFRLVCAGSKIPALFLDVLTNSTLPLLTNISLHCPGAGITSNSRVDISSLVNVQHVDTDLALTGSSLSNLQTLVLYSVCSSDLLHTLKQLAQLHTLGIAFINFPGWGPPILAEEVVELPSVKHLIWGRGNSDEVLNMVVFPHLEVFELQRLENVDDMYPESRCRGWVQLTSTPSIPLERMVQSGRAGAPPLVIIRDLKCLEDVEHLMQGFNEAIHTLAIFLNGDKKRLIPLTTLFVSHQGSPILPKLKALCVPATVDPKALPAVVDMWKSRGEKFGDTASDLIAQTIAMLQMEAK
ncbi:hypothetical protein CYLTODRAFT_479378 [Cylindrobasidium torrendii FP15055 ss-10]|uniref:F-box domain-containing protein n=1 Tax=Cylindrobasidium torrendii FP15055 ss-10 TaxID=1314674 RepID=A0A0D7ASE6_9AGAR|nr:hypothetical protein CYLTODRAFT_479378 [Cylindrobasidium torrendii FP15055 ss-10]